MRSLGFALLLVTAFAVPALAQSSADNGGPGACREFGDKFCSGKQGPDRRACLAAHADQLSGSCRTRLANNGEKGWGGGNGQAKFAPCRDDLKSYCPSMQGADRYPCLQKNEAKLSKVCKEALPGLAAD